MNITIVTNQKKYSYHSEKKKRLCEILSEHKVSTIDMDLSKPLHEIYFAIEKTNPELLITFDFAGFELRTELHTPTLFKLHCRGAHILFDNAYKYGDLLDEPFNLGHFVYVVSENDMKKLEENYSNIPDVKLTPDFEDTSLCRWFEELCKEAML